MKRLFNYPFDFLLYPAMMIWLGNIWGGVVMTLLSIITNLLVIRAYDWSKTDWLCIEALKGLREKESTGKWKRFIGRILQKSDVVAFFVLCFDDPITVTLYLRHGSYQHNGMSRRDWKIFLSATIVANLYWIIGWTAQGISFENAAKKYETEIADLVQKKKRVFEMREEGEYSREQSQERVAEIDSKIMAVRISLNESRIEQFDIEATVTYATNFISNLSRVWFDLPPHLQPRFQKLVLPEGISYHPTKKFGTTKLGLIYELNQKTKNSFMTYLKKVDPIGFEPMTSSLQMRRSTN